MAKKVSASEKKVHQIRCKSRKQYSGDEKIRILLDGLRGNKCVSELRRHCPGLLRHSLHHPQDSRRIESTLKQIDCVEVAKKFPELQENIE